MNKYFAYGSNMNKSQMINRCPGSTAVGPGLVRGYRVVMDQRGVATIIPAGANSICWGGLWEVSDADIAELDQYEGVVGNYYSRELIKIELGDEVVEDVIVYVSMSPALFKENLPRPGYLNRILKGARDFDLPESYLNYLAALGEGLV